jgi:hypothetical protein
MRCIVLPRIVAVLAFLFVATACGTSNQSDQAGPDKATRDLAARTTTLLSEMKGALASIGARPPVGAAQSAFVAAAPKTLKLAVRLQSLSKRASILALDVRRNGQPGTKKLARLLEAFAGLFTFEARQSRALATVLTTSRSSVPVFCNLRSQVAEDRSIRAFFDEVRAADPNPSAFARAIRRVDTLALDHLSACDNAMDSETHGRLAARQYISNLQLLMATARAVEPDAPARAIHQALSLFLERLRIKQTALRVFVRTGDLSSPAQRARRADYERTDHRYHAALCKVAPEAITC